MLPSTAFLVGLCVYPQHLTLKGQATEQMLFKP